MRPRSILPREFYGRPTPVVARELLGMLLVRELGGERLSGFIVETEAYCGVDDEGCHAHRGRTRRTAVMFGPPGYAYIYFIYGMHYCFNVVTEEDGIAGAVLVRAIHPLEGLSTMQRLRGVDDELSLTSGPARLCHALAIDRRLYGHDLCLGRELWLEAGDRFPDSAVLVGPRVGLRVGEPARSAPWRFALAGDPWVSRPAPQQLLTQVQPFPWAPPWRAVASAGVAPRKAGS
jgi:DNA-3-methyladenine glycosylase